MNKFSWQALGKKNYKRDCLLYFTALAEEITQNTYLWDLKDVEIDTESGLDLIEESMRQSYTAGYIRAIKDITKEMMSDEI